MSRFLQHADEVIDYWASSAESWIDDDEDEFDDDELRANDDASEETVDAPAPAKSLEEFEAEKRARREAAAALMPKSSAPRAPRKVELPGMVHN